MIISRETLVKPTSGEPCVNQEAEQIVRLTRNGELTSGSSKAVLDLAERALGASAWQLQVSGKVDFRLALSNWTVSPANS